MEVIVRFMDRLVVLMNVFSYKIADFTGIDFRILLIGDGMFGTGYYPEFLGLGFGFVQRMYHPRRYKRIGIAVDEKHGQMAFSDLF